MTAVMSPRIRRPLALLLGTGLALTAFELVLQGYAYFEWSRDRDGAEPAAGGGLAALCVGDSFTYGIGASDLDYSYPSQLQEMLRSRGRSDVTVVNGGWPGRNSGTVLERLAGMLERHAPAVVYVMIGYNDRNKVVAEVLESDPNFDAEHFPLEYRTAKFIGIIADWLSDTRPALASDSFMGHWHNRDDGREIEFFPDGRAVVDGVETDWRIEDRKIFVRSKRVPSFRRGYPMRWRRDGVSLVLTSERWEHTYDPGPPPPGKRRLAAGRSALHDQRWEEAASNFRACLSDPELEHAARDGLVRALAHIDPAAAEPHLDELRRAWRARPERDEMSALARGLAALGHTDEAHDLACRYLETHGRGTGIWPVLSNIPPTPERDARTLAALRRATTAGSGVSPLERAAVWRALGVVVAIDPIDSVRCQMHATALDGISGLLAETVQQHEEVVTPDVYARLVDEVTTEPESRKLLRSIGASCYGVAFGPDSVLTRHLRRIVACCESYGATPVLLSYPLLIAGTEGALQQIHSDLKVDTIDVRAAFDKELLTRPREELFCADHRHCSDAGYAILADLVLADLLARLPR